MKLLTHLALATLLVFGISGCTKVRKPLEAKVTIVFDHVVDSKGLEANTPLTYLNAAGNYYNVKTLKYIISKVVLVDQSGTEVAFNNYDIIDAFGNNKLGAVTLPNGTYKSMRFTLGVNPVDNMSSSPIGNLSPGGDMYFSSSDGYIFLKHEGEFLNSSNEKKTLIHHYGKSGSELNLDLPVGGLTVNGVNKTAYVTFNLNEIYKTTPVNFNDGPVRYSSGADASWVAAIKGNLASAFQFNGSYEDK